jgi:SAM-dependent methyltransferase
MATAPTKLPGFDNRGEAYHDGEVVLRRVDPEYRGAAIEIFKLYQKHALHSKGIVETELDERSEYLLRHKKLLMTYPAEWPASMFKDAALFHLRLLKELPAFGLTLKDALPNNVLFEKGQPRLVDFLSLVRIEDLAGEDWLVRPREDPRTTVLRRMFVPAFLTPLLAMAVDNYALARSMLATQSCQPRWKAPHLSQIIRKRVRLRFVGTIIAFVALVKALGYLPPETAYSALEQFVCKLDVEPHSGYSSYYAAKKEDFSLDLRAKWKPKQLSVQRVLSQANASKVVDLGANTGWFSRLAARMGSEVVSLDVDEASLNHLYRQAKTEELNITPLRIAFGELDRAVTFGYERGGRAVMFPSLLERIQVDTVLLLGMIHHLVLGEGRSLDYIASMLRRLAKRSAIVEFVNLDDALIAGNPDYFPKISSFTAHSYNLDAFLTAAGRYFTSYEILESHPETRKIVYLH